MNEAIETLKELLADDEVIYEYGLTSDYNAHYCIVRDGNDDDIVGALEETLHRLLDADIDPWFIMGAYVPSEADMERLNEFDEYIDIDLGYVLEGLMTCFYECR